MSLLGDEETCPAVAGTETMRRIAGPSWSPFLLPQSADLQGMAWAEMRSSPKTFPGSGMCRPLDPLMNMTGNLRPIASGAGQEHPGQAYSQEYGEKDPAEYPA